LPQQVQVRDAISVVRQDYLPGVAALRNVMGNVDDPYARKTSHLQKISEMTKVCDSASLVF
jgi:hypothetical protein